MNSDRVLATSPRRSRSLARCARFGAWLVILAMVASTRLATPRAGFAAADNARQIVEEAQRRTEAQSQRYEGLLQVFDSKGKISDKRWTFERLGAHGNSKAV